jgi:hypothetical protein
VRIAEIRYGEKIFGDLFVITRKWLGLYLEIIFNFHGDLLGFFWTAG